MGKPKKATKRPLNAKKIEEFETNLEEKLDAVEEESDSDYEGDYSTAQPTFLQDSEVKEDDSSDSDAEIEDSEDDEDYESTEEQSEKDNDNVSSDSEEESESDGEIQKAQTSNKNKKTSPKKSIIKLNSPESSEDEADTKLTDKRNEGQVSGVVSSSEEEDEDEYKDYDTSDEEDIRCTEGNINKEWLADFKHLGYDWDGKKVIKPDTGDRLDEFLKRMEDPDFWRTVKDPQTGQNVILSDEDIEIIKRIRGQQIPDREFEEYAPWIEWFTSKVEQMPIRNFPEHKRSFLPSKDEAKKVSKLVHALKMGWIKTREEQAKLRKKKEPTFYMLWKNEDDPKARGIHKHIPAPKRLLPGHAESYNPPPEYLFDAKELKEWNKLKNAPWKRKHHFIPEKYDALRKVPAYPRFIKERFLRCLDLYLCPRAIKMKLNIEPESLVPKLPSPRDLQPFPTTLAIQYKGHTDMVRTISTDHTGQYLLSGSDDCTIKIWEVNTGRCLKTVTCADIVRCVEWCPNHDLTLVLVAAGNEILIINPGVGDFIKRSKTDSVLGLTPSLTDSIVSERVKSTVQWCEPDQELYKTGVRIQLKAFKMVSQVTWHGKGDYFGAIIPDGQSRSVLISQLSKRKSQLPFTKSKGLIQCIKFHPKKPFLFVATQRHVRIYDLLKQTQIKKLMTNSKWISTMDVHPMGDNLLVGTYDRKMLWFDLDLSTKPYQTLRLHGTAVRGVAFHKRYPLFASGSDDRSLIISHGMVYNDLLQNPLIVPLKRLQDHQPYNDFGILGVHFHPFQPWVFSCGADSTIILYSN